MFKPLLMPLLAPLLGSTLLLACDRGEDIEARTAELASAGGVRVKISNAGELPPDTVHAIAQHLEGPAKSTGAAMVRLKKEDGAAPVLEIELWGGTVPPAGDLASELKATFPALASADIQTSTIAPGEAPSMPVVAVEADLSPAEAEQQIRDQLAADGVDGQVKVKVQDGPEGRRVEVAIDKHETK